MITVNLYYKGTNGIARAFVQEMEKQDERDVDEFIKRLKKYAGAEQLTREMCFELIEYVTVDELTKNKEIPRKIHIYYKFLDKGLTKKLNALL